MLSVSRPELLRVLTYMVNRFADSAEENALGREKRNGRR